MSNNDDFLTCRSCGMTLLSDLYEQCASCRYGILEEEEMYDEEIDRYTDEDANPYRDDDTVQFTMTSIEQLRWRVALGVRVIRWKIRWTIRNIVHKIKWLVSAKYRAEYGDGIPF